MHRHSAQTPAMNIANPPGVQAATSAAQDPAAGEAQVLVLKKALDALCAPKVAMIDANAFPTWKTMLSQTPDLSLDRAGAF